MATWSTLTAYWPDPASYDPQNPVARDSSVQWSYQTSEDAEQFRVHTGVRVNFDNTFASVDVTVGTITFTGGDDGSQKCEHYWRSISVSSQQGRYITRDVAYDYWALVLSPLTFTRKTSSYSATINVTYEVAYRKSSTSWTSFKDGREKDTASFTITVPALPTYTISYNANGGSGAPSSQTKMHGTNITLSSTVPTRNGYTFNSWNTSANGDGAKYNPSATYTANNTRTLYAIWNPIISFNGNGGSNVPSPVTKTFNQEATIPSNVPRKDGYVFVGWNNDPNGSGSTTYQPSATVPADYNTTLTLYAIYAKITAPPTISTITVVRCNSSGVASDMGTYAKVTAVWSVDRTYDSANTGLVTGEWRVSGSSSTTSFAFSSGHMGASGTATVTLSGFDTDTQYEFIVEVQDTNQDAGHTSVTQKVVILTRAKFIMDLKAGGEAMGLFSAAPSDGLEVGKDMQVDGNLTVLGNVTASNLTMSTASGASVASAQGSFSMSSAYAYRYGPFVMVCATFTPTTALTAGAQYTLGTLTSDYTTPREIGFANQYGIGYARGTSIYYSTVYTGIGTSHSIYVTLMYIKP